MNRYIYFFAIACGPFVPETCFAQQKVSTEELNFFEKKIRPVLVEHCYRCHSEEAAKNKKLKAELFLDTRPTAAERVEMALRNMRMELDEADIPELRVVRAMRTHFVASSRCGEPRGTKSSSSSRLIL